jgi:hypothetical protein
VLASLATVILVPHSLRHSQTYLFIIHAIPFLLPVTGARPGRLHIGTRTLYQLITPRPAIARLGTALSTKAHRMLAGRSTLWAVHYLV